MADLRATEERTDEDLLHDEDGAADIADHWEQPPSTTESILRRKKTRAPRSTTTKILVVLLVFTLSASAGVLVFMIKSGISVFYVQGDSMNPTFKSGTSIVLKQARKLEKGQIVVVNFPENWDNPYSERTLLIKRLAAIPGDTIEFDGKSFIVNGKTRYTLPEGYDCTKAPQVYKKKLNSKEIFILGDNPSSSVDSRYLFCKGKVSEATVSTKSVVDNGKVIFEF